MQPDSFYFLLWVSLIFLFFVITVHLDLFSHLPLGFMQGPLLSALVDDSILCPLFSCHCQEYKRKVQSLPIQATWNGWEISSIQQTCWQVKYFTLPQIYLANSKFSVSWKRTVKNSELEYKLVWDIEELGMFLRKRHLDIGYIVMIWLRTITCAEVFLVALESANASGRPSWCSVPCHPWAFCYMLPSLCFPPFFGANNNSCCCWLPAFPDVFYI